MIRTWHIEATVMAAILAATVIISDGGSTEWIGAAAVWLATRHMSVADRGREKDERRAVPDVSCLAWLDRYLVGKELFFCWYFIRLEAWSALVGGALFLVYPFWRRLYRRWRPMERSCP